MFYYFVCWGFHIFNYGLNQGVRLRNFSCVLLLGVKVAFGLGILFCVCLWLSYIVIVFKQRYQEHTSYLKHNDSQSAYAYALYILKNKHECGPVNNTVTLFKHINKTTLLIPFEHLYMQSYYHHKQLIPEQHAGEHNPIHQLIHDLHNTSFPTRLTDQTPTSTQPKTISTLILLAASQRRWYVQHFTIM